MEYTVNVIKFREVLPMRKFLSAAAILLTVLLTLVSCGGDSAAPNGMKSLSTDLCDYNLYIPTGWVVDEQTRFVAAYVSDNDRTSVSMEAFELENASMTVSEFWDSYADDFAATLSDMEMVSEDSMLLGGAAAVKYVYDATVTGDPYRFMQVVAIRGGTVYIFTYTATPEMYEEHLQAVEAILGYFTFR